MTSHKSPRAVLDCNLLMILTIRSLVRKGEQRHFGTHRVEVLFTKLLDEHFFRISVLSSFVVALELQTCELIDAT
jgi:hypothetical protein